MKYIKRFEDIKIDKRMGIYVLSENILYVIDHLKEKDIRFMLLFGTDDNADDECFLILIEGNDYKKLDYNVSIINDFNANDYYIEIDDENVFLNWFEPENIEGDWEIIRNTDKENIEALINSKKFNI